VNFWNQSADLFIKKFFIKYSHRRIRDMALTSKRISYLMERLKLKIKNLDADLKKANTEMASLKKELQGAKAAEKIAPKAKKAKGK
jgi:hypothetical protein